MTTLYTPDIVFLSRITSLLNSIDILDVGCGDGRFLRICKEHNYNNVRGCDPYFYENDNNERINKTELLNETFEFKLMQDNSIPFDNALFDVVVSNQVFEHVIDKKYLVSEILRVLKPGGMALISFPTSEVVIEPHVKLPWFHRFDLTRKLSFVFFIVLVTFYMGSFPNRKERFSWLKRRMKTFTDELHYISNRGFIELVSDFNDATINELHSEVFGAFGCRHPKLFIIIKIMCLKYLLLSQISRYYIIRKKQNANS